MKISFDLDESDASGKHKFISRLRSSFLTKGYEVVPQGSKSDLHLFVNKPSERAKRNVFRLDGIWINTETEGADNRNQKIRQKIKAADGVIYQNEFCKEATERLLSIKPKRSACILNGASASEFRVEPLEMLSPYFLAMCKWRPHKRLPETIEGFLRANIKHVDLVILGETDYKIKHPKVHFLGWQDREMTARYLAGCIGTVHLCYLDWCPNSVVESIVAKKQVIYSSSGGTPYIVKNRGSVVEDKPWDWKPFKLYDPPKLDLEKVAKAYYESYRFPLANFDTTDVDIETVANQYDGFLRAVLEQK